MVRSYSSSTVVSRIVLFRYDMYLGPGGVNWAKLFKYYDRDNSGRLDEKEFRSAVRRDAKIPASQLSDLALLKLFRAVDSDRDGTIAVDEFVSFLEHGASRSEASMRPPPSRPQTAQHAQSARAGAGRAGGDNRTWKAPQRRDVQANRNVVGSRRKAARTPQAEGGAGRARFRSRPGTGYQTRADRIAAKSSQLRQQQWEGKPLNYHEAQREHDSPVVSSSRSYNDVNSHPLVQNSLSQSSHILQSPSTQPLGSVDMLEPGGIGIQRANDEYSNMSSDFESAAPTPRHQPNHSQHSGTSEREKEWGRNPLGPG